MSTAVRRGRGPGTRDERGAVAVMVALLIVPLIGFAAISVDLAALWSQRQQLQIGADAAVLAIASDCLNGVCGTPSQTASDLAAANLRNGSATATVTNRTSTEVTVSNSAPRSAVFSPVLGIGPGVVSAKATARWGSPTGGTAALPVLLNYCEYSYQTGGGLPTGTTSYPLLQSRTSISSCPTSGFSGGSRPGGFVWPKATLTNCSLSSALEAEIEIGTSISPLANGCTPVYLAGLQNKTVMLPVFRSGRVAKNNDYVTVYGYAPFRLTGYYFGPGYSWNSPCTGSERCLRGYFTRITEADTSFTYGSGPALGGGFVTLIN